MAHTILIVDDEKLVGDMLVLHLEEAGFKTQYVSDGPTFLNIVSAQKFSLALIDIWMPHMSGIDVLDCVIEQNIDIAVIMMSEHGSENLAVNAMKRGALDYIPKPFELNGLIQRIDSAITNVGLQRSIKNRNIENNKIIQELREEVAKFKAESANSIIKSIEFDEDSCQAGVSILSYFSTVVNQKYPGNNVKIRIEQEARKVRLVIVTPDGEKEKIEKTLEEYGLVVVGDMQPADLLSNELHVLQLRHKLEMTVMELSYTRELCNAERASHSREIEGLKEEVAHMRLQISEAFKRENQINSILDNIIETHKLDGPARDAIAKLSDYFSGNIMAKDKEIILELIGIVKKQNTSAYDDLKAYALSTLSGASGGLLSTWINAFFVSAAKI